ncbi:MAG: hypothetical protein WCJ58_01315 [bacterium]
MKKVKNFQNLREIYFPILKSYSEYLFLKQSLKKIEQNNFNFDFIKNLDSELFFLKLDFQKLFSEPDKSILLFETDSEKIYGELVSTDSKNSSYISLVKDFNDITFNLRFAPKFFEYQVTKSFLPDTSMILSEISYLEKRKEARIKLSIVEIFADDIARGNYNRTLKIRPVEVKKNIASKIIFEGYDGFNLEGTYYE